MEVFNRNLVTVFASLIAIAAVSLAALTPLRGASAHVGTGLCGVTNLITAEYMWQYTNPDGSHYHTWDPYGPEGIFDYFCGYV